MKTEFEATFPNIDKDQCREALRKAGADLIHAERLQKRYTFDLPPGFHDSRTWARVRDEGDRVTMSVKSISGDTIHDQKELCVTVDSFETAVALLERLGCEKKAFQETKRELWKLGAVEIMIDEWPFLEPLIEIEGPDEASVRGTAEALGFDWQAAQFCTVGRLYGEKYGVSVDTIYNNTHLIAFDGKNPFISS